MPIYPYQCPKCNFNFELLLPIPGQAYHRCPKCGGKAERKIASVNSSFGWRLSDASNEPFHQDELVRDI